MPPCCVINKNSDKHCGNWALKNKTCCWVHRALEDSPIPTEREVLVDEAIKKLESDEYRCVSICLNGKRCSRFYNNGKRFCGQHWIKAMNQKDRGNILPEPKPQKDSDSESDSESDDPTYYARIKKRS